MGIWEWVNNMCPNHPSDDYIPQESPHRTHHLLSHKEHNGEGGVSITKNFSGGFLSGPVLMVEKAVREFVSLTSMKVLEP